VSKKKQMGDSTSAKLDEDVRHNDAVCFAILLQILGAHLYGHLCSLAAQNSARLVVVRVVVRPCVQSGRAAYTIVWPCVPLGQTEVQ